VKEEVTAISQPTTLKHWKKCGATELHARMEKHERKRKKNKRKKNDVMIKPNMSQNFKAHIFLWHRARLSLPMRPLQQTFRSMGYAPYGFLSHFFFSLVFTPGGPFAFLRSERASEKRIAIPHPA